MIHELNKVIFVKTPHGDGQALFIIDYGEHYNTIWVICLVDGGQIKHYDSNQISITTNYTLSIQNKHKNNG